MEQRLVLQSDDGKVLRAFEWTGDAVQVVRRGDTKRLELVSSLQILEDEHIHFEWLQEVSCSINQKTV